MRYQVQLTYTALVTSALLLWAFPLGLPADVASSPSSDEDVSKTKVSVALFTFSKSYI